MRIVVKKWILQYGAAVVKLHAMKEETCGSVDSCLPEKVLLMSKLNSLVLFLVKPPIMTELYEHKVLSRTRTI